MDTCIETLYSELRKTRNELVDKLNDIGASPVIRPIIKEELSDVEDALNKLELGVFGKCEVSGELIPVELLGMVPTIKTLEDYYTIDGYFRKSL